MFSYTDKLLDTLTAQEKIYYEIFLEMRQKYNNGCYDLPYLSSFEEVSKDDVDEEDRWLSHWYIKECQTKYDRVMDKINKLNYLSSYFFKFERKQIKFLLDSLTLNEKNELRFHLYWISNYASKEASFEEMNLLSALNILYNNFNKNDCMSLAS